jgi:manganese-dependent ADP-ribose/CDP-alcohol diphosphatase
MKSFFQMTCLRIGLIADVQYADIDDVWNYMRTHKRKYRSTLRALANAINWWSTIEDMDLVVDLGDAIDGYRNVDRDMGLRALGNVVQEWKILEDKHVRLPIIHLIGNHELYKFTRDELIHGVGATGFKCTPPASLHSKVDLPQCTYYTFPLRDGWRVVVLDPYDVSVMRNGGGRIGHELTLANGGIHAEYADLCQSHNPNNILDGGDFFKGISGIDSRWVPFNGGVGKDQLKWLNSVLQSATHNKERVIVFTHIVLHPLATPKHDGHTLLWNYDEVLGIFAANSCVRIVVAGHAHHEGYHECPETRIHHITMASPLEAPDEVAESTFGLLELPDGQGTTARLIGRGWMSSLELKV